MSSEGRPEWQDYLINDMRFNHTKLFLYAENNIKQFTKDKDIQKLMKCMGHIIEAVID